MGDPHCKGFISDGTRECHISLSYHCSFYYNLTISLLPVPIFLCLIWVPIFPCLLALMLSSWPFLLCPHSAIVSSPACLGCGPAACRAWLSSLAPPLRL